MNRYELIKKKYNLIMIQAIAYIVVASSTPVVINAMESSYRHNNDIINSILIWLNDDTNIKEDISEVFYNINCPEQDDCKNH